MQVSNAGIVSINASEVRGVPVEFPTTGILLAPFWADADTTTAGTVRYGIVTNSTTLASVAQKIRAGFNVHSTFTPAYVFIVTWNGVGYFDRMSDLVST